MRNRCKVSVLVSTRSQNRHVFRTEIGKVTVKITSPDASDYRCCQHLSPVTCHQTQKTSYL